MIVNGGIRLEGMVLSENVQIGKNGRLFCSWEKCRMDLAWMECWERTHCCEKKGK